MVAGAKAVADATTTAKQKAVFILLNSNVCGYALDVGARSFSTEHARVVTGCTEFLGTKHVRMVRSPAGSDADT